MLFRSSLLLSLLLHSTCLHASVADTDSLAATVKIIATTQLQKTSAPSASIAIIRDGQVAYIGAFGSSRLSPVTPARSEMRYAVGSVSKQFTAAAVLFLVQDGKLSLDDHVSKWLPDLTRSNEVTLRMLLSHTSGYSDYWPEDYVTTDMMQPVTPTAILEKWAKRPLDFDPGTKWQYSNTNYVIAGQIVEKVANIQLFDFLNTHVFNPLNMATVYDVNQHALPAGDAAGYYRHALGPLRHAPKEGPGWLTAAGELSMTPADLAKWDISMMNRSLLKPQSYDEMFKEVKLKDGSGTGYGLGVSVNSKNGHQYISHSGEVSGFTAQNTIVLDKKAAVIVLVNEDVVSTAQNIAASLLPSLIGRTKPEERVFSMLKGLQNGMLDRTQLTPLCNNYFTAEAISDFANSLKPLGDPLGITQGKDELRGGMTARQFVIQFASINLNLTTYEMPDGKLEQLLVWPRK